MDTRKITLIATIAVIALIAVGVGYAYTATTQNSGNNAQGEYVTLTQTGNGAYQFTKDAEDNIANIYYDTINTATGTSYKLASQTTDIEISSTHYACVQVGSPITLHAALTNADADSDMHTAVSSTGFNAGDGWFFILKTESTVGPTTKYLVYDGTWNDNVFDIKTNGTAYVDSTVTVYYGYNAASVPATIIDKPLINANLVFTATHDGSHTGTLYNINLMVIGGNGSATVNKSVAASGATVTVTATPSANYIARVAAMETDGTSIVVSGTSPTFTFTVGSCDVDVVVTNVAEFDATVTGGTSQTGDAKAYADSAYVATITSATALNISVTIGGQAATEGIDYTLSKNENVTTITVLVGHVTGPIAITGTPSA